MIRTLPASTRGSSKRMNHRPRIPFLYWMRQTRTSPIDHHAPYRRSLTMAIRLGETAPDFTADTTEGKINFH